MHKITKGLKKKKKGKKSKHKEDDLFKPEELEAYRREHQQTAEGTEPAASGNEEWKKFIALTSGVDDILKKTQGDLDRIKSTSFFQRIPPPSETKKQEEEEEAAAREKEKEEEKPPEPEPGIVHVSESESEEEEDDDIFDTAYIDAIAAGEVKLAYIPESPTEKLEGDDPFDTSIAERAILGPAVERKGKKLVPLGAAVEVLTGRVQAPTCATKRPVSRRQILKEKDLLLGSFDEGAQRDSSAKVSDSPLEVPKTLLDEDAPPELSQEPVDLSRTLHQIVTLVTETPKVDEPAKSKSDILEEFDVIKKEAEDEEDQEFALLAAESLSKTPAAVVTVLPTPEPKAVDVEQWDAFNDGSKPATEDLDDFNDIDNDPFDTAFAENILPGKAELKLLENEILNANEENAFRPEDKLKQILNSKVSIHLTNPGGERESISSLDRIADDELNTIKPSHRDLLGGSNTDLSNLGDTPLKPAEQIDENYIEYGDPFDTETFTVIPGQTELKFLEKELLADIKPEKKDSLSDDDFDPRALEEKPRERTQSRPEILNIVPKTVSFDLPSPTEESSKIVKPLTPYYVRENSIPAEDTDPFDTSFVPTIAPGKAELKVIEQDLFNPQLEHSISDQNFDPRNDKVVTAAAIVQKVEEIYNPKVEEKKEEIDLFALEHGTQGKVLTPAADNRATDISNDYVDPFDTSIANNILPGRTELKLLENELLPSAIKDRVENDLLVGEDSVIDKPLSPITTSDQVEENFEDFDPFDTSIANNIAPGRSELKLIESELI